MFAQFARISPALARRASARRVGLVAACLLGLYALDARALVFDVNSKADTNDSTVGDGQCSTGATVTDPVLGVLPECTLRAAIAEANAWIGRDRITFTSSLIYNANSYAFFTPATDYPVITDPIDIDGTSAPAFDPSQMPRVLVTGSGVGYGLYLLGSAGDSTIKGLTIRNFTWGLYLNGTDGAWVDSCSFGLHRNDLPIANNFGISLAPATTNTTIGAKVVGRSFVGYGNVISGNDVGIDNYGTYTSIIGNKIGTDLPGTHVISPPNAAIPNVALGNASDGIVVHNGIGLKIGRVLQIPQGGIPPFQIVPLGNVIAGNGEHGIHIVEMSNSPSEPGMTIVANQIGTGIDGLSDLGNTDSGIFVSDASADLQIGSLLGGANVIAGNGGDGIELGVGGLSAVDIVANKVGVGSDGLASIANDGDGIHIGGGDPVTVLANLVGNNGNNGILVEDRSAQALLGTVTLDNNHVGVSGDRAPMGNVASGIKVDTDDVVVSNNVIGLNTKGIELADGSTLVSLTDNFVGTDETSADLGNSGIGIHSTSVDGGIEIGAAGHGNVVGWNHQSGIVIRESTSQNDVIGNRVGVDDAGHPIPNVKHGIRVTDSAIAAWPIRIGSDLSVPSTDFASRENWIAFNGQDAISVESPAMTVVRGNRIRENADMALDLDEDGVTPNDFGDADVGANNLQNSPELNSSRTGIDPATGDVRVEYRVTSDPANTTYPLTIDFYLSDGSAFEPLQYLGSDTYPSASAHLQRAVQFAPQVPVPSGLQYLVAMATNDINRTSEVSAPVAITLPEPGMATALGVGLLGLGGLGSRRRTNASRTSSAA